MEKKDKKHYLEHKEHKQQQTYKVATYILLGVSIVLLVGLILTLTLGVSPSQGLSEEEITEKTVQYVGQLVPGQTVTVTSVEDQGSLYAVKLNIAGQSYDSYVTKDGSLLFPSGIDMTKDAAASGEESVGPAPTQVPKTDKPVVELFVMSHCPYGTQSEKGILPAVRALGDTIDFKVRFVYYAMHGKVEIDEQVTQYCIQKEQPAEYLKYLACFLNASDSPGCLASTGVDKTKLAACTAAADTEFDITKNCNDQASWLSGRFPLFNTDKALNEKYGIGGSPTLVINGVQSNAGRSPSSYLAGICAAFNNAPAECQTQLDTANPGPGFGYDSTSAASAAGCGV